jgi:phosphonopyruvate decarboxylase
MGNFATIGAFAGGNFRHLLLDNQMHESTGGQPTVSSTVSFAAVASACGYRLAQEAVSEESLQAFMQQMQGPALMQLHIRSGVPEDLPRPDLGPPEVRQRLMRHLGVSTPWAFRSNNDLR